VLIAGRPVPLTALGRVHVATSVGRVAAGEHDKGEEWEEETASFTRQKEPEQGGDIKAQVAAVRRSFALGVQS
jgi:hypothetical protein